MKKPIVPCVVIDSRGQKIMVGDSDVVTVPDTGTLAKYSPPTDGPHRNGVRDFTSTRITGGPWAGKQYHRSYRGRITTVSVDGKELDPDDYVVSSDGKSVTLLRSHTRGITIGVKAECTEPSTWTNDSSYDCVPYSPGNRKERRTQESLVRRGKRVQPKRKWP